MVNEDNQQDHHGGFDQEVLARSLGDRKKFQDLSPEEIAVELK